MKISDWYKALPKKNKLIIYIICALILLDVFVIAGLAVYGKKSALKLKFTGSQEEFPLKALNSSAKKAMLAGEDYAYYKFTEKQKNLIKNFYSENQSAAILLRLKISPTTKQSLLLDGDIPLNFEFGFLWDNDFTDSGKFKKQIYPASEKIVIQGDERKAPEVLDVSFSFQRNEIIEKVIPMGFFVRSALRCYITDAAVVPAQLGFDSSTEVPFYGFAYNGGKIDFENNTFDFSGAAMVFPVKNSLTTQMPEFTVKLSSDSEFKSTIEQPVYIDFSFGGEKLYVKNVTAAKELTIPSAGLKSPFSRMDITANRQCITSVLLSNVKIEERNSGFVDVPVKTDPGLIQHYRQSNWRCEDYELFQWDRYPEILIFDTKDYDIQGKFFTRLAFFVEKAGYRGRLATDEELKDKHGYNAHDYKAEDLARFFNTAEEQNFPLNPYEQQLKQILIKNGLFSSDGNMVHAEKGEIASVSRETPDWSRSNLIPHELSHTLFFMDEEFRNYTTAVYHTCDPSTLAFLIDYFKTWPSLGYDINDQNLMYTEFMAYVMEQRTSAVAESFVKKANWPTMIKYAPESSAYIRNTEGSGFEDISNAFADFVFDKFGIVPGNMGLVSRY